MSGTLSPLGAWFVRHRDVRNGDLAATCAVTVMSVNFWRHCQRRPNAAHRHSIEAFTRRHDPADVVTAASWCDAPLLARRAA